MSSPVENFSQDNGLGAILEAIQIKEKSLRTPVMITAQTSHYLSRIIKSSDIPKLDCTSRLKETISDIDENFCHTPQLKRTKSIRRKSVHREDVLPIVSVPLKKKRVLEEISDTDVLDNEYTKRLKKVHFGENEIHFFDKRFDPMNIRREITRGKTGITFMEQIIESIDRDFNLITKVFDENYVMSSSDMMYFFYGYSATYIDSCSEKDREHVSEYLKTNYGSLFSKLTDETIDQAVNSGRIHRALIEMLRITTL